MARSGLPKRKAVSRQRLAHRSPPPAETGITWKESATAQKLAEIPQKEWDAYQAKVRMGEAAPNPRSNMSSAGDEFLSEWSSWLDNRIDEVEHWQALVNSKGREIDDPRIVLEA